MSFIVDRLELSLAFGAENDESFDETNWYLQGRIERYLAETVNLE